MQLNICNLICSLSNTDSEDKYIHQDCILLDKLSCPWDISVDLFPLQEEGNASATPFSCIVLPEMICKLPSCHCQLWYSQWASYIVRHEPIHHSGHNGPLPANRTVQCSLASSGLLIGHLVCQRPCRMPLLTPGISSWYPLLGRYQPQAACTHYQNHCGSILSDGWIPDAGHLQPRQHHPARQWYPWICHWLVSLSCKWVK